MKRRTFLSGITVLLATRGIVGAQHSGETKKVGWLSSGTLPVAGPNPISTRAAAEVAQFFDALKSYGWIEGQNLIVERRYAAGTTDKLPQLAAELVALNVDVIHVTSATAATAAKKATSTIPIVALASDMVGLGLVSSLARPDTNLTGQNLMLIEVAGKRLHLLRELLPHAAQIAVFGCGDTRAPATRMGLSWPFVKAANKSLKLRLLEYTPQSSDEVRASLQDALNRRADGLLVLDCPRFNAIDRMSLLRHRLPAIYYVESFAFAGGLMSYGPDAYYFFRRSAWYIDRILRGASPRDLPIEQPTKLRLVVNLKTAKDLRLTVPNEILVRADEVIE
jgi:putative ABC transport system substrate-binding protein